MVGQKHVPNGGLGSRGTSRVQLAIPAVSLRPWPPLGTVSCKALCANLVAFCVGSADWFCAHSAQLKILVSLAGREGTYLVSWCCCLMIGVFRSLE